MKISICNIAWDSNEDVNVYRLLSEEGIAGIEVAPTILFPTEPYLHIKDALKWKKKLLNDFGLEISSIMSIWYGRGENIFYSRENRTELMEYSKLAIQFAECLGARNVVFGCPKNRNGYSRDIRNREVALEFFHSLGEVAEKHNTVIGLEANPTVYHTDFLNTTIDTIKFIETIDSKAVKLNLDVGTIVYNNESLDFIEQGRKIINHVHISEPFLRKIRFHSIHRSLSKFLYSIDYKGYVSIEMERQIDLEDIREVILYMKEVFG